MVSKRITLLLFSFLFASGIFAQDTIVLLNGKTILSRHADVSGYSVTYNSIKLNSKQKQVNVENVFSIRHADGTERILYQPDSLEPDDYTAEQMRMYILGEQDAILYYRNNLNKVTAFAFGGGSAYFSFYGIIGPAVYATVIGSFSPKMEKQKVSDLMLLKNTEYREGYIRKARDKNTKNAILYGLAGFASVVATALITK
jgi:hypothetical protein